MTTVFISHGAPDEILHDTPVRRFWDRLATALPRPRAVIAVSAHFLRRGTTRVGSNPTPETLHDFRGFPARLNTIRYPAPGDPVLAGQLVETLRAGGLDADLEPGRGLDHGVWVPASRIWPQADLPVVPVSVDPGAGAAAHRALGQALSPLLTDGVVLMASGALTHNLAAMDPAPGASEALPWVAAFADWFAGALESADLDALLDWRHRAPAADRNHPTAEHLMPLFVALGASGPRGRAIHRGYSRGTLAMDAYAFGGVRSPGGNFQDGAAVTV